MLFGIIKYVRIAQITETYPTLNWVCSREQRVNSTLYD